MIYLTQQIQQSNNKSDYSEQNLTNIPLSLHSG